ncbi:MULTISPECIES: hypothetical protein [Prauserella salsuginis group]|uniref:Guanylate cyclase domain-containing protein n=1 Tax=Prauserella salsuginis TaxID=387889 RepID=A0ABW6G055_9PSEU|nr:MULTISPECIES: hypothetical protein [Prauserella salsuginis group]MCR3721186.1 hypothetical protein [Prauserella flava]MCR3734733.1 hypothetical protein [Prauserella salsuginis]
MALLSCARYEAQSHAVLAIDMVGSSRAPDDLLDPMKSELEQLLDHALGSVGLDSGQARHFRETGDGVMVAYPERHLVALTEVVFYLDHLLRTRNRHARFPIRARVAVHVGPMHENGRYHRTYITLTRLLSARAFCDVVAHWCRRDTTGERFGAALIMSETVWTRIVEPCRVPLVPAARCARVTVTTEDFHGHAWLHFPGLEADTALTTCYLDNLPDRRSGTSAEGAVPYSDTATSCVGWWGYA